MGRNIVYLTNYYMDDVIAQRNSRPFISQAGQNKSRYIMDMLRAGGNQVTVWSNAWTRSTSLRYHKGFQSTLDENLYYSSIFGFPFLNVWFCKKSCIRFLKQLHKKKPIEAIVFYNMRLENAPVALYFKKKYNIPILLQYEDGLTRDASVTGLKRKLYQRMERKTLLEIDGAFLVNSKIKVPCPYEVIRGAIRKVDALEHIKNPVPKILFASTLDEQRGVSVLLQSLREIEDEFELYVTGKGSSEGKVKECQDHRIHFLGFIDYEEYEEVLKSADICINAQLTHQSFGNFSFPSKIYEYLSYQKLVVSSDVADAREAIGEIAFVYENDDPKALAKELKKAIAVLKDEEKYKEIRKKIADFIEENQIEKVAERVNLLLDEIGVNQ